MNASGKGGFKKGISGNPAGRPRKEREDRFYEIAMTSVTFEDWKDIVLAAVKLAKRGDAASRKWLSDYLMGTPVSKLELTGKDGGNIPVEFIEVAIPDDK